MSWIARRVKVGQGRRLLAITLLGVAVALAGCGHKAEPPASSGGSRADLRELERQVVRASARLARQGVYLMQTSIDGSCVRVELANPTPPNREYLSRHFDGVCVAKAPNGPVVACAGAVADPAETGSVVVPNLIGLGIAEAERRVTDLGLTYAIRCLTDHDRKPAPPSRLTPEVLARITQQCPHPGQHVAAGAQVALDAAAHLPGGFTYPLGVLDEYNTGTDRPCANGRDP